MLADYDSHAYALHSMSTFPKDVSPVAPHHAPLQFDCWSQDKAVRDASTEASNMLNKFGVECSMRLDVPLAISTGCVLIARPAGI